MDRVRRMLYDLRRNFADHVHISLREVDPGLAGLTGHTRCDDHYIGILRIFISPRINLDRGEQNGVPWRISIASPSALSVLTSIITISGSESVNRHRIRDRGTDASSANDRYFPAHYHPPKFVASANIQAYAFLTSLFKKSRHSTPHDPRCVRPLF